MSLIASRSIARAAVLAGHALTFAPGCALDLLARTEPPKVPALPLTIAAGERLLVIAPHPDDESIGAGGLVATVVAQGGEVRVVTVTAGDAYREALALETGVAQPSAEEFLRFGERRIGELRRAVAALSAGRAHSDVLGFPDGALADLTDSIVSREPLRSFTTGADRVPYAAALEPGELYTWESLRSALARALDDFAPTIVALPEPLDQHPDHATTGMITLLEVWNRALLYGPDALPRVLAYVVHWNEHPDGWQTERSDAETARMTLELPVSLPRRAEVPCKLVLTDHEIAAKRAGIAAHVSQQAMMGRYLRSFARGTEPFLEIEPGATGRPCGTLPAAREDPPAPLQP